MSAADALSTLSDTNSLRRISLTSGLFCGSEMLCSKEEFQDRVSREGSANTHCDSFLRRNDRLNSDFVCSLPWSGSCTFLFDVSVRTALRVLKRTSSSDFFLMQDGRINISNDLQSFRWRRASPSRVSNCWEVNQGFRGARASHGVLRRSERQPCFCLFVSRNEKIPLHGRQLATAYSTASSSL